MENRLINRVALFIAAASAAVATHGARASVYSGFNLSQGVNYYVPGTDTVFAPVTDSAVPFHTAVSLDSGHGSNITSTYDVYDNGSTAGFSINTSAAITALSSSVGEVTNPEGNNEYTVLTFSQPVIYNLALVSTSTSTPSFGLIVGPNFPGTSTINLEQVSSGTQYNLSGLLKAGTPYFLYEQWGITNTGAPPEPVNVSGTESIVFTFTPVPEPSAVLLLLPALAAATRRRPVRRRKS